MKISKITLTFLLVNDVLIGPVKYDNDGEQKYHHINCNAIIPSLFVRHKRIRWIKDAR